MITKPSFPICRMFKNQKIYLSVNDFDSLLTFMNVVLEESLKKTEGKVED